MDTRRARSAFVFLALSVVFASAAPKTRAQTAAPISDAQFQKVAGLIRTPRGKAADLLPTIAAALGLSGGGKGAVLGRLAITDKQGTRYQISLLSGGKGYLLARHSGSSVRMFLMDANRALVSGLTVEGDQSPVTLSAQDASPLFQQDLAAWARIADAFPSAKTR